MWPKNRYVIHLAGKFALFVSGIIEPLSQGFFLKKKKKIGGVGGKGALSKRKSMHREQGFDISVFLFQDNICRTPERDELDHLALLGNRDRLVLLGNRDLLVLLGNRDLLDQKDQKVSRTNDLEIKGKTEAFITPTVNVGKRGKETPLLT